MVISTDVTSSTSYAMKLAKSPGFPSGPDNQRQVIEDPLLSKEKAMVEGNT